MSAAEYWFDLLVTTDYSGLSPGASTAPQRWVGPCRSSSTRGRSAAGGVGIDAREQPDPHRGDQCLGAVGGTELLVDLCDVRLHRRLRQVELGRDLGRAVPVGQQQQDVVLTVGEPGRLAAGPAHHGLGEARAQERPWRDRSVAGRLDHLGRGGVLADEGRGAGLHGREDLVVPECMVRTTSPARLSWRRTWRTTSSPVPSCSCRSVTTTCGFVSSYIAIASATVAAAPM